VEAGVTTGLGLGRRLAGEVGTGAGVAGASGRGSSSDSCLHTLASKDSGSPFPFPFPLCRFPTAFASVFPVAESSFSFSFLAGFFSAVTGLAVMVAMAVVLRIGVPATGKAFISAGRGEVRALWGGMSLDGALLM
jgi:hypothetical protein